MKKIFLKILVCVIITFLSGCQQPSRAQNTSVQDTNSFLEIKNLLDKAKEPSIDSEKYTEDALNQLVELLKKANPQDISSENISQLSEWIRIHESNNSRIIEYRQSPEDFGNSGRSTWKVFQYYPDNSIFMIEKNMPYDLEFYRIIDIDNKPLLYTYVRNFEVNQHKVHIFAYTFDNQSITNINSIDFESIDTDLWGYDKDRSMLWSKKSHSTFIGSVSSDGKEVVIKGWDTDGSEHFLNLELNDEGVYTCL
ncbi:hypothetical protein [Acetivibrio mesophilus]|uniref:Ig-like domain-containing protein n=1 Tax=Acetivibrio mesophilus TaxID=2487273 RepID=A0A4Q0I5H8_9FIRM|nr:hypothetical protein [Acetivibrio mesophilus]ODM25823.1 hypothetical protein A7W90_06045 [Clostridium sp. Bc-iso-3]RXE59590.1 hypothetical protein EFD62_06485 [Acetivibrio mesophilus]HHV30515.1 hypothetical protein [Clostridium sp.]